MTGLKIDMGVCHIISRNLLVDISAGSGGSGVKGHSKVKFRFEHNSCLSFFFFAKRLCQGFLGNHRADLSEIWGVGRD